MATALGKAFEGARAAKGPSKEQRFRIKADRSAKTVVPIFGENASLATYMGLPLSSYTTFKGITYTNDGFTLNLPLGSIKSMENMLGGCSLECNVTVAHDASRCRNVIRATRLVVRVDEAKRLFDAEREEIDQ